MPKLTKRANRYGLTDGLTDGLTEPNYRMALLLKKIYIIRLFPDLLANTKFVKRGRGY